MTALGAIFDVDGVLVDSPHERAWRESLRDLMDGEWKALRGRTTWTQNGFTTRLYQRAVSGKPRLTGARGVLEHFGVPGAAELAGDYATRKQAMVVEFIQAGEFTAYDALRFTLAIKNAGVRMALASSSENVALILQQVPIVVLAENQGSSFAATPAKLTLLDVFDVNVSGRHFARGKPDPEMFLAAAKELGVAPSAAVVVEDAISGIEAAKAASMGAIGVARSDDSDLLRGAGADIVVTSLNDVDVQALATGRLARLPERR